MMHTLDGLLLSLMHNNVMSVDFFKLPILYCTFYIATKYV